MNQAELSKLVSRLRIPNPPKLKKFRSPAGPEGRLDILRKTVTGLIKHERIELNYARAFEARLYAERLISDAVRYGDCHKTTMEMADYWLVEKQLVHKLFKVLVPRFEKTNFAYTKMLRVPKPTPDFRYERAVLELRGNPFPSLLPENISNRNLIQNVLLDEARKAYRAKKYAEIAAGVDSATFSVIDESKEIVSESEEQPLTTDPKNSDKDK